MWSCLPSTAAGLAQLAQVKTEAQDDKQDLALFIDRQQTEIDRFKALCRANGIEY